MWGGGRRVRGRAEARETFTHTFCKDKAAEGQGPDRYERNFHTLILDRGGKSLPRKRSEGSGAGPSREILSHTFFNKRGGKAGQGPGRGERNFHTQLFEIGGSEGSGAGPSPNKLSNTLFAKRGGEEDQGRGRGDRIFTHTFCNEGVVEGQGQGRS